MIILYSIAGVILTALAVGAFAYWKAPKPTSNSWRPRSDAFWGGLVGAGLVLTFVTVVGNAIYESATDEVEHYRIPLTSIGAGSATEGYGGFLGGGQIDTRGVFWYYRTDDGASTLHYRYADNTKVYQDETGQPYMDCWEVESAGPYAFMNNNTFTGEAKCDFHIPPNSVIQNYKLGTP